MAKMTPSGSKQKGAKPFRLKGIKLLVGVALLYGVAFLWAPDKSMASLKGFAHVLGTLIPILVVVVFLSALLQRFVNPKALAKNLGSESGVRGWMIALAAGVVSHGSMYAWYPMIQDLREKGAKDGLIVAFFYARAVKLFLLPMMAFYFGLTFTVVLTVLILLAAWGQGVVMNWLMRR